MHEPDTAAPAARPRIGAALALLAALIAAGPVCAQTAAGYPSRPIRLVVPFPPGGSNDILGRIVAQKLGERFSQQVVVDNRGGADGIIGADIVAKAAPDGHTLLVISTSYVINPTSHRIPYDPVKDFAAVAMIGDGPTVITSNPSFPAKDVRELIAMAKAKPGQIPYASSGLGGVIHLTGELFNRSAGINLLHVPYKGGGPAAIDVVAGQVPLLISTVASALTQLKAGKLRPLGVGSTKRSQLLPDVATIAESGVPGFDARVWWGVLAPARTPAPMIARLDAEIAQIVAQTDVKERIVAAGVEPGHLSTRPFARWVEDEIAKWSKIARQAGIRPQS